VSRIGEGPRVGRTDVAVATAADKLSRREGETGAAELIALPEIATEI